MLNGLFDAADFGTGLIILSLCLIECLVDIMLLLASLFDIRFCLALICQLAVEYGLPGFEV